MKEESENEKTQQPSEHKKEKFRKEGDFAISREFGLVATLIFLCYLISNTSNYMEAGKFLFSESLNHLDDFDHIKPTLFKLGFRIILNISIFAIIVSLGYLFQTKFRITSKKLRLNFSKLNVFKGIKNIFSFQIIITLLKTLAKIIILVLSISYVAKEQIKEISNTITLPPSSFAYYVTMIGTPIFKTIALYFFIIAGIDYGILLFKHMKKLKMDREEMKKEHKEHEGDPKIKQKQKQKQKDFLKKILAKEVPQASFVVTNPEHYAIAIKWELKLKVPQVVAKGTDLVAQKIKEIAYQHGIPVVRNPPLARSLYKEVELGGFIKRNHYRAIAQVIHYIKTTMKK